MKIQKYILGTIMVATSATMITSCNNYDFNKEMYRNDVSLLQASDGIYSRTTLNLSDVEAGTANIPLVVEVSGSQISTKDFQVSIEHSDSLFNRYNKTNFDVDTAKFAKLLPKECYEDPELNVTVPAGQTKLELNVHIKNIEGLYPDSTYFLEYAITTSSTGINKKKQHVLLKVLYKNDYASTSTSEEYTYTSTTVVSPNSNLPERPTTSLKAYPLASNKIRMIVGSETKANGVKDLDFINQNSVVLTIGDKTSTDPRAKHVTIAPYKEGEVEVEMLNPIEEYKNIYLVNSVGGSASTNASYFKEFRLHYRYRIMKATKEKDGTFKPSPWKVVKAIMRNSFNPRSERL